MIPGFPASDEQRYGWIMVAMVPLFLGFAIGSMGAIAVFIKPLGAELGWERGETAFGYLVANGGIGLGGILMGYLSDRFKTRPIVIFGTVVAGLGYLAMSQQNALWQFYLLSGITAGLGLGAFFAPLLANVGGWFNQNKGLALGIATAGQALGQGLVPYATSFLIVWLGWRGAFQGLGLFVLVLLLPLALLIRNAPTANGADDSPSGNSAPKEFFLVPPSHAILLLSLAAIYCCITMSTPLVHVVALATDKGLDPESAARVLLLIMVSGFFGRVSFGKLSDRIGRLQAYMAASAWQTALVFWFPFLESPLAFYALAIAYGFGFAGVMTCLILCAQSFVPLARSGIATGIVALFGFIGMGIGGFQAGFYFDLTGNYTLSYANATLSGIVNLMILLSLGFYQWKREGSLPDAMEPLPEPVPEVAAGD